MRLADATELHTTPLICSLALFNSRIKKFVVEPVPMPITESFLRSGSIILKASFAVFFFKVLIHYIFQQKPLFVFMTV
ncbi:MAG: hypothetical protein CM15mP86_18380 [Gammaproteobacteria bacterium]|nr:MAG: hypothetical protein CM15mP86_18380 [Gammaproteobacteria bacterium]